MADEPFSVIRRTQPPLRTDGTTRTASRAAEYTITRGNNVWAGIDRDGTNGVDATGSPDGGASLNFNQTLDLAQAPTTTSNQQAAVTNLFYLNNVIHDITYGYGFNEAAGNFQANNYGKGGTGNDAVSAEAQDSSGTNNANFATPADGQTPRMQMYLFDKTTPNRDGDLDATVVLHEYTHGISNRLTGGPADANALVNYQSQGMGEGWSDWMALMLTMKATDTATTQRTIGTYLYGQAANGAGFRRKPYTTDMSVNNQTIDLYNLNASFPEPHDAGELWCDALWDMTWNLTGRYGMSTNLYGGWSAGQAGNKLAIQLVINGMKLQPSNPTFKEARDAILQADVNLTGGVNADLIWQAFARRGMGLSFDSGTSSNATTVKGAFDAPGQISGTVYNDENDNSVIDSDEVGLPGVTVFVDANNNSLFDSGEVSATTDADRVLQNQRTLGGHVHRSRGEDGHAGGGIAADELRGQRDGSRRCECRPRLRADLTGACERHRVQRRERERREGCRRGRPRRRARLRG